VEELKLPCSAVGLELRLKQRGYHRWVACQKPYLTLTQVTGPLLWAIAHIFRTVEWRKMIWSDEVTFLVGGRTVKQRWRGRGERCHPTCIPHQLYRGHTISVRAWEAIGYGYKSPLIFTQGSGKTGAFTQRSYLAQILAPHIEGIVHQPRPVAEPLFMEDGNSAHGHKSTRNCCAKWHYANAAPLYKPRYEPYWEVLEEDQAQTAVVAESRVGNLCLRLMRWQFS